MQVGKTTYMENERYRVVLEEGKENGEIFVFIHLDVFVFNKSVVKEMREELEILLKSIKGDGHLITGFYLEGGGDTKFHEMIRPLDFKIKKGGHTYGGWYLEDL